MSVAGESRIISVSEKSQLITFKKDNGRFPFTKKFRKFQWETTNGEDCVPFDTSFFHSFPGSVARLRSFPLNFKMAAQMLILNEIVALSVEEEGLLNSEDDDETPILATVSTYMTRDLNRSEGFFENIDIP